MTVNEMPSEDDYGLYSFAWMLKSSLAYVPRPQLYVAVVRMIDAMVYSNDEIDPLDILAQYALAGRYIETAPHDCSTHYHEDDGVPPLTEEEIQEFSAQIGEASTAEDPFENFKIDKAGEATEGQSPEGDDK